MIVINLKGGVGNQLFQYCYGKNQANKLNTELKLDIQYLEKGCPAGWTQYQDELVHFEDIKEERITGNPNLKAINENIDCVFRDYNISDNTFLDGYWQNEKFVGDINIKFKDEEKLRNLFEQKINYYENIISIHARRGDYLNGDHFIDLSTTDYYKNALDKVFELISNEDRIIKNPKIVVFSNDIEWAKEYFKWIELPNSTSFEKNSTIEDLYLMSKCHHNITANSSYSWWGAKLNKFKDKIIIQPKQWLKNKDIDNLKLGGSIIL